MAIHREHRAFFVDGQFTAEGAALAWFYRRHGFTIQASAARVVGLCWQKAWALSGAEDAVGRTNTTPLPDDVEGLLRMLRERLDELVDDTLLVVLKAAGKLEKLATHYRPIAARYVTGDHIPLPQVAETLGTTSVSGRSDQPADTGDAVQQRCTLICYRRLTK